MLPPGVVLFDALRHWTIRELQVPESPLRGSTTATRWGKGRTPTQKTILAPHRKFWLMQLAMVWRPSVKNRVGVSRGLHVVVTTASNCEWVVVGGPLCRITMQFTPLPRGTARWSAYCGTAGSHFPLGSRVSRRIAINAGSCGLTGAESWSSTYNTMESKMGGLSAVECKISY